MDQLKVFLRQCVKYRFWITCGISLLLPMIGYFVGASAINEATTTQVNLIKGQQTEIAKYQAPNPPNADYKRFVDEKKAVLTQDVDAAWRKLYSTQEPLLKWPDIVEGDFRKWGRKWPENIDAGQVRKTIVDYTIAYPDFVAQLYTVLKAWNPEDGTGIVYVPRGPESILKPSPLFKNPDNPPELGKVWAEQERLWVLTALLDAIAKINAKAGATDWEKSIVKQINIIDVGTASAQDQRSMAKGIALVAAPAIVVPGAPAAPAAPAGPLGGPTPGGMGGSNASTDEVYSLSPETPNQPFKVVPIRLTVLVDQDRLPDFLVGLENSPMAIQVMETEFAKPASPVEKPVYGEVTGPGGAGGPNPYDTSGRMAGAGSNRPPVNPGAGPGRGATDEAMSLGGGRGPGGAGGASGKGGTSVRAVNKAEERKQKEREAAAKAKAKPAKRNLDQYYNVIEVTVYGQARFYNAPPPLPASEASRVPEAPKAETPKAETPKAEQPKAEQPKAEQPNGETPKVEPPKTEAAKPDTSKPDAPKVEGNTPTLGGGETPKAEAPKTDVPAGKADAPPKKP